MWLAFGFPNAKRERERGGRCGGEELERDVCMGVMELSLTHLLFSVVKTLCCLLALCFFDYYFFSKYIDIFFGETLRLLALLPCASLSNFVFPFTLPQFPNPTPYTFPLQSPGQ